MADPTGPPEAFPSMTGAPMLPPPPTPEELALLPHTNAGPRLNATIWSLLGLATAFLALRIYCKFLRHRGLWWDDWILIASWVCITIECCLLSHAVSLCYGKYLYDCPPDPDNGRKLGMSINVGGTFSVVAAVWSKTSFAVTLLRLADGPWMKPLLWFIIVSMNIAMGCTALFNWVHCTPVQKSWNPFIEGTCWDPYVRIHYNIFSAAYSAAMDITLALLPWKLIWGLQMRKKEKVGVAIAMSCGIFAGVTAIVKTTMIPHMLSFDPDDGVDLFIWGNAESCVTIIAASIPILRVLVREVRTSARKYYVSGVDEGDTKRSRLGRGQSNTITVSVTAGRHGSAAKPDDWSDRSILDASHSPGRNEIVRTNEIAVEYEDKKDGDIDEFEMHQMPRNPV